MNYSFVFEKKTEPIIMGITALINHINTPAVAAVIVFAVKIPINITAYEPRIAASENEMEGVKVIKR